MKKFQKQQENLKTLFELIKQNPDLEIIPMVSYECVPSDDFGYWAATWSKARVDEYWCDEERIYFKENDFDDLVEKWIDENFEDYLNMTDEELEKLAGEKVNNYDWQKVIVVYIEPC